MAASTPAPSLLRRAGRRWLKTPATVAVYRSRAVREPLRFVRGEVTGPAGAVGEYRLRGGGAVVLRHRSRDIEIFHEVVVTGFYDTEPAIRALVERPRVLDLGANIGLFGVRALSLWPGASVTSFEPDPHNLPILERCVAANGAGDRWKVVPAFASARDGSERFKAGMESYSRRARPGEDEGVVEVDRVDVLPLLRESDVVKIDIEGAEWDILDDPRWPQTGARILLLEYHRRPDGREHEAAVAALEAAGYEHRRVYRSDELGVGVIWAWRR